MITMAEKTMLDLFEKGNYLGSFESKKDIEDFLKSEIKRLRWKYGEKTEDGFEKRAIVEMNGRVYTILKSSHLIMEKTNVRTDS